MNDSASNIVHQPVSDGAQGYTLFDPSAELFSGVTTSAQRFRPPRNSFNGTVPRLPVVFEPSGLHTCVEVTPGNNITQNVASQWHTSVTGQCHFHQPPVLNERIVSYWTYEDDLITEYRPAFMASIMPQSELPGTEIACDQLENFSLSSPVSPGGLEESASESLSQAGSQSTSQECYILWKKIPMDAVVVTGTKKFVPQKLYKPFTEADKERYLERVSLSAPIIFMTKEPFEWGISLEDVRSGKTQHLVDKNDLVLQDCGPSVSIRISWPGYPPFKRQIPSRNWRKTKGPITKEKLAQSLAKTTGQFIEKMSNKPLEVGAEGCWKVGPQHIKMENLVLVSLHHVSKGSWQPQFRLRFDVA